MKIKATEITARDLQPGDLFSTVGPEYWNDSLDLFSIGERVYIRTNVHFDMAPDADRMVYKIEVLREEEEGDGDVAGGH